MDRKETTKYLSELLEKKINPNNDTRIYYAKEVTFDYSGKGKRIDFLLFKPLNNTVSGIEKGDFFAYEIKSSVADFKSKNGHNTDIADFSYYVMPIEVYEEVKTLIPWHVGVYCPEIRNPGKAWEHTELVCVRKGSRMSRNRAASEMLLMMFRSANRENIKRRKDLAVKAIEEDEE